MEVKTSPPKQVQTNILTFLCNFCLIPTPLYVNIFKKCLCKDISMFHIKETFMRLWLLKHLLRVSRRKFPIHHS